jgi:hypothetical protein
VQISGSWRGWLVPGLGESWAVDALHPALKQLVSEVQAALDAKLFHAAITVALAIPDICSGLESNPNAVLTTPAKYKAWFDSNLAHGFAHLTADDCYRLRAGVLHHRKMGRPKARYDRIVFLPPDPSRHLSGETLVAIDQGGKLGGVKGRVLQIEVVWFCQQFVAATLRWARSRIDDANVQINLPNLVRYRPEGLFPYIVGVPLIA